PVKALGDEARLVGLDASDEMPDDVEVGERVELRLRFLSVALAEIALSGPIRSLYRFRRLLFADRDDRHIARASSCAFRRNTNALTNRRQMLRDICHALDVAAGYSMSTTPRIRLGSGAVSASVQG